MALVIDGTRPLLPVGWRSRSFLVRSHQGLLNSGLLKEAFITLSSPEHRLKYDSELSSRLHLSSSRSRPAHIVSLEDFEDLGRVWIYDRRCGLSLQ